MTELFGIPLPALLSQLLLGLVNGSFYAILSLGLAVIFGLLNVINFAHGALYMMGAMFAWMGLTYFGLNYWVMLIVAPLLVGVFGVIIERLLLRHLYKLDHLYGLLLTFGLTLLIEGFFRSFYGVSGLQYQVPEQLAGARNLGFMILPNYRAWVVLASLIVCFGTWYVIERTKLGRAAARRHRKCEADRSVRRQRAVNGDFDLRLRRCAGGLCRRAGGADPAGAAADGQQPDHRRICGGGHRRHGIDHGLDPDRTWASASSKASHACFIPKHRPPSFS